jgi:hypothetical protein
MHFLDFASERTEHRLACVIKTDLNSGDREAKERSTFGKLLKRLIIVRSRITQRVSYAVGPLASRLSYRLRSFLWVTGLGSTSAARTVDRRCGLDDEVVFNMGSARRAVHFHLINLRTV